LEVRLVETLPDRIGGAGNKRFDPSLNRTT
jgi:hypothetical protein